MYLNKLLSKFHLQNFFAFKKITESKKITFFKIKEIII